MLNTIPKSVLESFHCRDSRTGAETTMIPHSVHTPPNHSTGGGDVQRESKRRIASRFNRERQKGTSHAGNRTRIGRVRACYPNRLDYMGPVSDLRRGFIRAHPPLHQRLKLRPITHSSAATKTTKRKKRKQYCYKSSSTRDPRTHSSPSTTFSKSWSSSTCDCATSASIRSASSSTELSRSASTASSVS